MHIFDNIYIKTYFFATEVGRHGPKHTREVLRNNKWLFLNICAVVINSVFVYCYYI